MAKNKKKVNTFKEEILIQKENKRKIILKLIQNFLLNPKAKYTRQEILKDSLFVSEYFKYQN